MLYGCWHLPHCAAIAPRGSSSLDYYGCHSDNATHQLRGEFKKQNKQAQTSRGARSLAPQLGADSDLFTASLVGMETQFSKIARLELAAAATTPERAFVTEKDRRETTAST